ncbi:MAG: HEAT repeat domain-containing protein [Gammaproteobacteria bacterium]
MRRLSLSILFVAAIAFLGLKAITGRTPDSLIAETNAKPMAISVSPDTAGKESPLHYQATPFEQSIIENLGSKPPIENLYPMARESAVSRKMLMENYRDFADDESKGLIVALLSGLETEDVQHFALQLAESNDPLQRKDGFGILENQTSTSAKVRGLAMQAIATENDTETLRRAIASLHPTTVPNSENNDVLQQLQTMARHQHPAIRAQAMSTLADWDKTGESAPALEQALTDSAAEVRWAAVDAIENNRIRSDSLKTALITLSADTTEAPDLRLSAVKTLEHFSLDHNEYDRLSEITREIEQN